jgi:hypothetical protein
MACAGSVPRRGLDCLFESGRQGLPNWIAQQGLISNAGDDRVSAAYAAAPTNWQAIARQCVNGSAVSSSATLIASDVVVLSADPFGSQSPPLGNLGRALVSPAGQARLAASAPWLPAQWWETTGRSAAKGLIGIAISLLF